MTEEHRSDGRSIDENLAKAKYELDKTPDEPQQAAEPGTPEPDENTPDYGHTFDHYGEIEEPQPEEELPPEPPRKRHKRIVPLFVKIILYVVIVAVVSVGAGYAAWACATDVLAFGRSSETIQVTVPENASLDAITDMLLITVAAASAAAANFINTFFFIALISFFFFLIISMSLAELL